MINVVTIVNNPKSDDSGGIAGVIMALVILIVVVVLLYLGYVYGLPALKQIQSGGTQINVPSSIDVNIKQTK